jgi:hypothetical protein
MMWELCHTISAAVPRGKRQYAYKTAPTQLVEKLFVLTHPV